MIMSISPNRTNWIKSMPSTVSQIGLLAIFAASSIVLASCSHSKCPPSEADGQLRFSASRPGIGFIDVFEACLEAGGNPNSTASTGDNMEGWTPLLLSAYGGFGDATRQQNDSIWNAASMEQIKLLLEHGADINAKTPEGENALYLAAVAGRIPLIEFFLSKGLPLNERTFEGTLNERTPEGKTPLYGSLLYGRKDVVSLLLEKGADPNIISSENQSILDFAVRLADQIEREGIRPTNDYDPPGVVEILKKHGAKPASELVGHP
jgi:ankyrin repeat protein